MLFMELTYTSAMQELESIIKDLQEDLVSLDDLTAKAARAAFLVQWCRNSLRQTDEQLQQIFETGSKTDA